MQKMPRLWANRKLLKRKLVDIENHIRGALRTCGLLVGAVGRGGFEARIRVLIEHADYVFSAMIEAMRDVRRAIFDGYERVLRSGSTRSGLPPADDGSRRRTRCGARLLEKRS
jgi:transposase